MGSVVTAIHNVLPASLQVDKVEHAVGSANALATGVALAGGLSNSKGNVYFLVPRTGQWGGVCADGFTRLDADTVCRQLGFSRGAREFYGVTAGGGVRGDQFGSCPIPSQSAWVTSTLLSTHHFVAQGASLIVQVSRLALDSFLHSP